MSALIEKSLSGVNRILKNIVRLICRCGSRRYFCAVGRLAWEEAFYKAFSGMHGEAMPEGGTITVAGGYRRLRGLMPCR